MKEEETACLDPASLEVQYVFENRRKRTLCCLPVLLIRDVYPGSRILIFTHPIPGSGSRIPDPGSGNSNKGEG